MYKNLFALPNLRPYRPTKHKNRIIPAVITGRIFSLFLLLYYTPNSLCWLDGGPPPPTKTLYQKLWGSFRKLFGGTDPPVVAPLFGSWFHRKRLCKCHEKNTKNKDTTKDFSSRTRTRTLYLSLRTP